VVKFNKIVLKENIGVILSNIEEVRALGKFVDKELGTSFKVDVYLDWFETSYYAERMVVYPFSHTHSGVSWVNKRNREGGYNTTLSYKEAIIANEFEVGDLCHICNTYCELVMSEDKSNFEKDLVEWAKEVCGGINSSLIEDLTLRIAEITGNSAIISAVNSFSNPKYESAIIDVNFLEKD